MKKKYKIQIRYMQEQDLPEVGLIQSRAHGEYFHESSDVFKHKLSLFKEGCFVAQCEFSICGYLFSHPWVTECVVPLNSIYSLPDLCNTFYIHDCCVDPAFQKKGIGLQLFTESKKTARLYNYRSLQLISINGMQKYWMNMGFAAVPATLTTHYGSNSCLMHASIV